MYKRKWSCPPQDGKFWWRWGDSNPRRVGFRALRRAKPPPIAHKKGGANLPSCLDGHLSKSNLFTFPSTRLNHFFFLAYLITRPENKSPIFGKFSLRSRDRWLLTGHHRTRKALICIPNRDAVSRVQSAVRPETRDADQSLFVSRNS